MQIAVISCDVFVWIVIFVCDIHLDWVILVTFIEFLFLGPTMSFLVSEIRVVASVAEGLGIHLMHFLVHASL